MDKNNMLQAYYEYVTSNWNASLGYGEDEKVYYRAAEDAKWFLDALRMSPKDFVEYCKEHQMTYNDELE